MVDIIQHPHDTLRAKAAPVTEKEFGTPELETLVTNMQETLARKEDGVALAAPQINISKRIFIVSPKAYRYAAEEADEQIKDEESIVGPGIFINPEITKRSRKKAWVSEGCLSVRWKYGEHKRPEKATVRAQDLSGNWFSYNGSGLIAQIFEHEVDHLDGVLFIDNARDIEELPPEKTQNEYA